MIREICLLSVLSGAVTVLIRPGAIRQIAGLLSAAALLLILLGSVFDGETDVSALYCAKLRDAERIEAAGQDISRRLNRDVIEREYEAYIMDKASALNTSLEKVSVQVQWSMDGLWVPYSAVYTGKRTKALEQTVTAELGIPSERQKWTDGNE